MADLDSMPYLSAVVKEVLRLYPAIPVFPRQAAAEDRLPSGHRVRKGGAGRPASGFLQRCR